MQDKTILITGATSGLGKATAIALAQKGASILFNSRDEAKGKAVQAEIQEASGNSRVQFFPCDLSSLAQVRTFAQQVHASADKIDVLINNAGVMPTSRQQTQDGFELGLGVNYLAGFLLTESLLDKLKAAKQGRIILVSSMVHKSGNLDLDKMEDESDSFKSLAFYARSKLAQVVYMKELAYRLRETAVTANALHPGVIGTDIARDLPWVLQSLYKLLFKSPEKGAQTQIYLASDSSLASVSGQYFQNKKQAPYHKLGDDEAFREALVQKSRKLVGLA